MNSKQLNFYSHPDEIGKFINFLQERGAYVSYEPFLEEEFQIIQNASLLESNPLIFKLILFKNNEQREKIVTSFVKTQNYHLFENIESNIVQFSFPKIRNTNILYRARFYFVTAYWENGVLIKKDEEFINWATSILKNFKKEFLKVKEPKTNEYYTEFVKSLIDDNKVVLKVI